MRIHNGTVPDTVLIDTATTHDGVAPLSEQFLRGLSEPELGHTHAYILADEQVVALAAGDGASWELVVHPAYRRRGLGTALLGSLGESAHVWAHGNLPAAKGLAAARGWASIRELLVMGVDWVPAETQLPDSMVCLNLDESAERFGRDAVLDAWLAANNEAFDWHPEQGGWDRARLDQAMAASWFNPADVLLLWDGDQLAGFHWTKRHSAELGEVYVVGLAAAYRGRGLGDPLVRLGLDHLAEAGMGRIILYVEADNVPAVAAYEKLGFEEVENHVLYAHESAEN